MVSTVLSKIRINYKAIIINLVVSFASIVFTFALNSNKASKDDLKNELASKATIVYVDKCFENQRQVSAFESQQNQETRKQVNEIYNYLIKNNGTQK
jgi:hypothetical protein